MVHYGLLVSPMTSTSFSNESSPVASHEQVAKDYLRTNPQLSQLFLELTTTCNLCCQHCGSSAGACSVMELSVENIFDVLNQLQPTTVGELPKIDLTGGEPMMHSSFWSIAEMLSKRDLIWGMTTNATLVDRDTARRLRSLGIFSVSVSIDGLRDDHDWLRGRPWAYERAVNGIRHLVSNGVTTDITTVVHRRNISHLDAIASLVTDLGVRSWRLIPIDPIGRALNHRDLLLNKTMMEQLMTYIVGLRKRRGSPYVTTGCSHFLGEFERKARSGSFFCGAGITVASIRANGDICACLDIPPFPQTIQGNINSARLYDVWSNKFRLFRTKRQSLCTACSKCEDADMCTGDSWHTWDFANNTPLVCKHSW